MIIEDKNKLNKPCEVTSLKEGGEIAVSPLTGEPITSVFYADIERALLQAGAPKQFKNKKEVIDFLNKNNIKKSESIDYRIPNILKTFGDDEIIDKNILLTQIRQAPIRGVRVHATGLNSELINPTGKVNVAFNGYIRDGSIADSYRERVLYIPKEKLPGDSGEYPSSLRAEGADIDKHAFGEPDNAYIIAWSRLTDRYGKIKSKIESPISGGNLKLVRKNFDNLSRQQAGLFAEAQSKLQRRGAETIEGFNQADIDELTISSIDDVTRYKEQLDSISPGMVDQIDEIQIKLQKNQEQLDKMSAPDLSGIIKVTYADEIQSDLMQAAARRQQFLGSYLRRLKDQGKTADDLKSYDDISQQLIKFYEENKNIFRPLESTAEEINRFRQGINKLDEGVDEIVNKYVATREISDNDLTKLSTMLNDNIDSMLDEIMLVDSNTISKLFPDLPYKTREEWGRATIQKDLFEGAYRKFILKDPNAPDMYAIPPGKEINKRYRHKGGTDTPQDLRDADKIRRLDEFKRSGNMSKSEYTGIGVEEFYGGVDAKSLTIDNTGTKATNPNFGEPKHYTGTLEKILQQLAKQNNTAIDTISVQVKNGAKDVYQIVDQNGNMVATLTNKDRVKDVLRSNPQYQVKTMAVPDEGAMQEAYGIPFTREMLEMYPTHKARGGLVEDIDVFEVA